MSNGAHCRLDAASFARIFAWAAGGDAPSSGRAADAEALLATSRCAYRGFVAAVDAGEISIAARASTKVVVDSSVVPDGTLEGAATCVQLDFALWRGAVAIGRGAFSRWTALTALDTRGGLEAVITIGDGVFSHMGSLTSADLRGLTAVTSIAAGFMENCPQLAFVSTEGLSQVRRVGPRCFAGCDALAHVDLCGLRRVESVDEDFLAKVASLRKVAVTVYRDLSVLGPRVLQGTSLKALRTDAFPAVTTLADGSFRQCPRLAAVDLSGLEACVAIGSVVLAGCPELRILKLGRGLRLVKEIGSHFAALCPKLEIVTGLEYLAALTTVGSHWFAGAKRLRDFDSRGLSSVTALGPSCLAQCDALERADLSGLVSLTELPTKLCFGCKSLKSFDASALRSVAAVGSKVCGQCTSLTSADLSFGGSVAVGGAVALLEGCTALTSVNKSGIADAPP